MAFYYIELQSNQQKPWTVKTQYNFDNSNSVQFPLDFYPTFQSFLL